jgi:hypothetical protein
MIEETRLGKRMVTLSSNHPLDWPLELQADGCFSPSFSNSNSTFFASDTSIHCNKKLAKKMYMFRKENR